MFTSMADKPCGYLDDARRLYNQRLCLEPVSKNLRGELRLMKRERQECEDPKCLTLKTDHVLKLEVQSHARCDSDLGKRLDGVLIVRRLVHAFTEDNAETRGIHTGEFTWFNDSIEIVGEMSGMTNVGTHRKPVFDKCQKCHDPGYMEGRLCGRIVKAEDHRLVGCRVTAAYRMQFDPSAGFQDTEIQGTLEGAVVCACDQGKCIDFTGFPKAEHPNPWTLGDCMFDVRGADGLPKANNVVTDMGGAVNGLDAGYETKISLGNPADQVTIRLINYSTPAQVVAYDSTTAQIDAAAMTVAGAPETLTLSGPDIATVVVRSPQNETLILEFCAEG